MCVSVHVVVYCHINLPSTSLPPHHMHPQVGGSGGLEDTDGELQVRPHNQDSAAKRSLVTASSATLELDQLMQNLEEFEFPISKPTPGVQGSKKPVSGMDNLSNMLGSLEMDMENIHGVSTVAKGMCAACKKPILAKVLDALGKQWHPEHFTCAACEVELATIMYYESGGRPYCEKDYHELFAPRCAYCNGPILDVSAVGSVGGPVTLSVTECH